MTTDEKLDLLLSLVSPKKKTPEQNSNDLDMYLDAVRNKNKLRRLSKNKKK